MPLDGAWNAYIFREGKNCLRGTELLDQFVGRLDAFSDLGPSSRRNALLDLLIRSGELECALADHDSSQGPIIADITDALAEAIVSRNSLPSAELALRARMLCVPEEIQVTAPEGFAFYSLHPLDFADLVQHIDRTGPYVAVVGIRSIGTTLGAVVQAALRANDVRAGRIAVRPVGHPYDRHCDFNSDQLRWIAVMLSHQADFLVVDEGPGMSGSSFLSVGDALISAGVPRSQISFLGSRTPDPSSLTARNAAVRWVSYRSYCVSPTKQLPRGAERFIAGGIWRADVYANQEQWPASWLQMERLKFTTPARDTFFKFEGYGRFGESVHQRSLEVAEAGFGPTPLRFEEGFGVYPMQRGRTLSKNDVNASVLQRIADYCAFRTRAFPVATSVNSNLETMMVFNIKEEFGIELSAKHAELPVGCPVIADGRMLPHKWIETDGALLKVDNAIHGDDHFFPGPTDIAWDLAGAIVEWELNPESAGFLLDRYFRLTGDDAKPRLPNYLMAYGIFRTAFCKMAAASMQGAEEEVRLEREHYWYRAQVEGYLHELMVPLAPTMTPALRQHGLRVGGLGLHDPENGKYLPSLQLRD